MGRTWAVLTLAVLTASGCASQDDSGNLDGISTVEPGKLTVCTDAPYEPFEFEKDGRLRGIDIDLVESVASELNTSAQFRDVDFDDIFSELNSGNCDFVASAVSITESRKEQYAFSDGYFEVSQSLLVRASDSASKGSLDALSVANGKVGVQAGTTGADYVAKHAPELAVAAYDDAGQLLEALSEQAIDGIVQDSPINSYAAKTNPSLQVVQTFSDESREEYGFAFAKTSAELRDRVNTALNRVRDAGKYDEILNLYLGSATK